MAYSGIDRVSMVYSGIDSASGYIAIDAEECI